MVPHTFKQQGHLPSIKGILYKGLSLCLSSHQCLLMMHAAHVCNIDTLLSLSLIHTLNHCFHFSLSASLSVSLSLLLPFVVFVWLLGFVCLLFPDGRRRLHLCGFQVPRELFTALAQALILFPLARLYDGPFIRSNWKQLSLPVRIGEDRKKPRESGGVFFPCALHLNIFINDRAADPHIRIMFFFPLMVNFIGIIE